MLTLQVRHDGVKLACLDVGALKAANTHQQNLIKYYQKQAAKGTRWQTIYPAYI